MSARMKTFVPTVVRQTRTISITSGKGGVGKTTVVANMATQLAKLGKSVLILDGDLGMANVDIMFGVRSKYSIYDLLHSGRKVEEVLTQLAPQIWLLPGGSGHVDLQNLNDFEKRILLEQLSGIKQKFDYLLVDTAPGIDSNVMYFNTSAQEICVVVTPDPSSFTDAYALIKVLNTYHQENKFFIIANQVRDEQEGMAVFQKLSDISQKFLFISLDYLGAIPSDISIRRATKAQQICIQSYPDAIASQSIKRIVERINNRQDVGHAKGGIQFFWEQIVGVA